MTYTGPERRRLDDGRRAADDFHDRFSELLREVTAAEVAKAITPLSDELNRLRRVIEGGNGDMLLAPGVVGTMQKVVATDETHNDRLTALEKKWDRLRWTVAGAALGGGIGGGGVVAWIVHMLSGGIG